MKTFFCTYQKCDTVSVYHHQLPESTLIQQFSRQKCHISITGHATASTHGIIKESSYDENEKKVSIYLQTAFGKPRILIHFMQKYENIIRLHYTFIICFCHLQVFM
jgi:hypothetical protein